MMIWSLGDIFRLSSASSGCDTQPGKYCSKRAAIAPDDCGMGDERHVPKRRSHPIQLSMTGRHLEGKSEAGTFAPPAWRLEMKARKSAIKDHWRCEYSFKPIAQDEWVLFSLHVVDVKTP